MARKFWQNDAEFNFREHSPVSTVYWDDDEHQWLQINVAPGDHGFDYLMQNVYEGWLEERNLAKVLQGGRQARRAVRPRST